LAFEGKPMELTRIAPKGRQLIQAHREGGFTIAGVRHEGSVLVLPDRTLPWSVRELSAVTMESLEPVTAVAASIDILILGAGATFGQPGPDLRQVLRAHGIVIEAMDTRAACRTFNVLLAEDRRVAAALIAR
ncbi:MAG TPA: Mth938-like domain-containing protein, partial [Geminicoccaceae bacterium]|nr:Mth938-like domain-containing protein [Geminicoccaceae bacterium]